MNQLYIKNSEDKNTFIILKKYLFLYVNTLVSLTTIATYKKKINIPYHLPYESINRINPPNQTNTGRYRIVRTKYQLIYV